MQWRPPEINILVFAWKTEWNRQRSASLKYLLENVIPCSCQLIYNSTDHAEPGNMFVVCCELAWGSPNLNLLNRVTLLTLNAWFSDLIKLYSGQNSMSNILKCSYILTRHQPNHAQLYLQPSLKAKSHSIWSGHRAVLAPSLVGFMV